jgi:hypothetical protein
MAAVRRATCVNMGLRLFELVELPTCRFRRDRHATCYECPKMMPPFNEWRTDIVLLSLDSWWFHLKV